MRLSYGGNKNNVFVRRKAQGIQLENQLFQFLSKFTSCLLIKLFHVGEINAGTENRGGSGGSSINIPIKLRMI